MEVDKDEANRTSDAEDEMLVLVELAGIIGSDFLDTISDKDYKVLGIETENPVIQIGHNIFTGEYKDTAGTLVLFEENETSQKSDTKELEYKFMTQKKLVMKRAFLNEKNSSKELPPDEEMPLAESTTNQK